MHTGQSCRDLVAAISDYIDGELTPRRCHDLETHLAQCPCCDRFTDSLRRAVAVCRAAGETRLPSGVQRRARARIAELLDELEPRITPSARPRTRVVAAAAKTSPAAASKPRSTSAAKARSARPAGRRTR